MAQLVARFHGMEEVRGSNPLSSTISATILRISVIVVLFFYCRNVRVNTRLIGQVVLVFGLSFVATKPKGGGWTRCDLSSWLARSCWFYPGF